jgi:hypothetical protein
MDTTGRSLRSGADVPAIKSPQKGSGRSSGEKSGSKTTKLARGKGGKFAKVGKLAAAMKDAESLLGESTEEVESELKQRKRAREDVDKEEMEKEILQEAELLSKKVSGDDKSLKELESRRMKALDDVDRYNHKATLVKTKLTGKAASKKTKEIKAKLAHLEKLLSVIRGLVIKRQDFIYALALKEITEAKRQSKRRRTMASTMSEDSEGDSLDVSEGECPFPRFMQYLHSFAIT